MTRDWQFWFYIMASKSHVIYIGMTDDLVRRVWEHKSGAIEGFSRKYRTTRLAHLERFQYVKNCIRREKQVKGWTRARKIALIEETNPRWEDLAADWFNADGTLNDRSKSLAGVTRTDWKRSW